MNNLFSIIIFIFFILAILIYTQCCINKEYLETFINRLQPAQYPLSVDKGILEQYYQTKLDPQLSKLNYRTMSKNYPIYPSNSLRNNNLKYWSLPDNGTCFFPELCNNMYNELSCEVQE